MSRASRRRARRAVLPTAGQTVVSLSLERVGDGAPWPLTRVLTALADRSIEREGVARALGDRHGVPLVHSQNLRWRGLDVYIEARHMRLGDDELMVELPPWDELVETVDDDEVWGLVDVVAAAADARFGCVGDGEAPEHCLPDDAAHLRAQLRRHLALLLPDWTEDDVVAAEATAVRTLDTSGLLVVTS